MNPNFSFYTNHAFFAIKGVKTCVQHSYKKPITYSRQNTHTHENPQIQYYHMNPKLNGLVQISYVYVIKGYKSYEQHAYVKTHEPFQTTIAKIMKIPTLA